jgi:hypothetical protein
MNTLKRITVTLLAVLPLATGVALAEPDHGYSRIFIFGASFMDPGNRFADTGLTAHPPFEPISFDAYGVGGHHFSNGRTWVEFLAQDMGLTEWAKPVYRDPGYGNYAYAYALAADLPEELPDPLEPSLYDQVKAWDYNGYCTHVPMHDTLFILDTSYADLLGAMQGGPVDPMPIVGGMLDSLRDNIEVLHLCGARNLLVANMPPLGMSPLITDPDAKIAATGLSWMYNLMVQDTVLSLYSDVMNIKTVDVFGFATEVLGAPLDFGFSNTTETCVTPYVTKGAFCKDRDAYLLWDALHLTKKANALLAERALQTLTGSD